MAQAYGQHVRGRKDRLSSGNGAAADSGNLNSRKCEDDVLCEAEPKFARRAAHRRTYAGYGTIKERVSERGGFERASERGAKSKPKETFHHDLLNGSSRR
jgi:hypothetical protein